MGAFFVCGGVGVCVWRVCVWRVCVCVFVYHFYIRYSNEPTFLRAIWALGLTFCGLSPNFEGNWPKDTIGIAGLVVWYLASGAQSPRINTWLGHLRLGLGHFRLGLD